MALLKRVVERLIVNRYVAGKALRPILSLHTWAYNMAGKLAVASSQNGTHPKHAIMGYKEWFLEHIEPDWVVLDIGSNTGMMPLLLSSKASFVYGVELNRAAVEQARAARSRENIVYFEGDATTFDFSQCRPIDCVTLSNVLEHIECREDFLRHLLKSIKWKDAACRHLLIRVPCLDREWIVLFKKNLGLEYRLDAGHYIEYTIDLLRSELAASGITIGSYEIRFGEIWAVCTA